MGEQPSLPGELKAGAFLLRSGPFLGLAVLAVILPAVLLVPVGLWLPVVALPVILVALALAWRLTAAVVPVRPVPVWSAAATAAIAAGEGLWAALTHADTMILRRDPGSYALYAQWIATRHGLPVSAHLDAFGGTAALAVPGFSLASPAYYQVVHGATVDIVPQFLLGAPALYSLGWWAGGWNGMFLLPPLLGLMAVLAMGALAARVLGPRWAPAAAGMLALTFPVLHAARSTYSEAPALVIVLAAAALAVDALARDARAPRVLGGLAGLVLGLAGLVRIDSLTEVALLVPVCALLALRGHPAALPMAGGGLAGIAASALPAVLLSRPYLDTVRGSLLPLVAATGVLVVGSAVLLVAARLRAGWRRTPAGPAAGGPAGPAADDPAADDPGAGSDPRGWWPDGHWEPLGGWGRATAGGVLALGVLIASRPLWLVTRQDPLDPGSLYVAAMQRSQGLPVDGGRTYAEDSLQWVSWWIGPVAVLAAWVAFAVLAGRAVAWWRGGAPRPPGWLVPAAVGVGSSVLTLLRPGITPDHPWADRRLVVVLLPTFVLAAVAVAAWCVRWARRRLAASLLAVTAGVAIFALGVGTLAGSAPFVAQRTEVGEPGAAARVCAALRPGDVVLAVDARGANEWPQVLRGVCGVPAAGLTASGAQLATSVAAVGRLVQARGGRLVLLAAGSPDTGRQALTGLGTSPREAVSVLTSEDQRTLARAPWRSSRLVITVWLADWPTSGG